MPETVQPEPTQPESAQPEPRRRINTGPGRLLLGIYAIFAVGATSRSAVQIIGDFDTAPLAYSLSALAAVVYVFITVCLIRGGELARRLATASCVVELLGVLGVGALTVFDPDAFPDATVWSDFGKGYLFLPVVLPVVGLLWLRGSRGSGSGSRAPRRA